MLHKVSECQNWEVTFFPLVKLAVYFTELVVPRLVLVVKDFGGQIEQTGSFCDQ